MPPFEKVIIPCLAIGFVIGLITGILLMLNVHSDLVLWYSAYGKN